jgi:hypothetical protein
MLRFSAGSLFATALLLTACGSNPGSKGPARPIVMGDPATIVTETDSQYLRDALPDFAPVTPSAAADIKAPETAPKDTATIAAATPPTVTATLPAGSGLTIDFDDLSVKIPGLQVRNATRNVKGQTSVAYSSEKADVATLKNLVVAGTLKVESVQQKSDYGLLWTAEGKSLPLSKTGTESAGWQALTARGGDYKLAAFTPPTFKATPATLRAAATDAVKHARLPRGEANTLNSAAGKIRSVDGTTVKPVLRTVIWQIKGKNARGRGVSKEIRIDMPV